MDDKQKFGIADTFVPYEELTTETKLLKALAELLGREDTTITLKILKARAMLEEITEGTTVQHRYQPPRVSWTQRVLSWFRGCTARSR